MAFAEEAQAEDNVRPGPVRPYAIDMWETEALFMIMGTVSGFTLSALCLNS
jgi:hypothetical protein